MINESLTRALDSENTHVAHHLFQKYSTNGEINKTGVKAILQDIYGGTDTSGESSDPNSVEEYFKLLDFDQDGKIGFGDIENFVSAYLSDFSGSILNVGTSQLTKKTEDQPMQRIDEMAPSNSFQSFDEDNLEIAYDIFKDFDQQDEGEIDFKELSHLVKGICTALQVGAKFDKEALNRTVSRYPFSRPGKITWDEFRDLYLKHFNF